MLADADEIDSKLVSEDRLLDEIADDLRLGKWLSVGVERDVTKGVEAKLDLTGLRGCHVEMYVAMADGMVSARRVSSIEPERRMSDRDKYRDNDDLRGVQHERIETDPDTKAEARGDARENVGNTSRGTAAGTTGPGRNDQR